MSPQFNARIERVGVLIIGTGGAGMRAAIEARKTGVDVCMLAKGPIRSTHTRMSGGRYNAITGQIADDSYELFFENTVNGGGGINNQELARILTDEAMDRAYDLESFGLVWERQSADSYLIVGTGGGTRLRALGPLEEGIGIVEVMIHQVIKAGIRVRENQMLVDLVQNDNGDVTGGLAYDLVRGEWVFYDAGAVVIATGGTSQLYETNSGPAVNTGDGIAAAYRAGAELIDIEFMQFIPISFVYPESVRGYTLTEPAYYGKRHFDVKGEPGKLLNTKGERFVLNYDPVRREGGTRDILARAIMTEILEGRGTPEGGVWLEPDPAVFEDFFHERPIYTKRILENYGEKAARFQEPFQVVPSALYMCGGIRIDTMCRSTLTGLLAAGEAAGGVHGANRLGGNSMPDIQVFGRRAGISAAEIALAKEGRSPADTRASFERAIKLEAAFAREKPVRPAAIKRDVQKAMWKRLGPVRDGEGLHEASDTFGELRDKVVHKMGVTAQVRVLNREWQESLEMQNLLDIAQSMTLAALTRKETRGNHYRRDFPTKNDDRWSLNLVVSKGSDGPKIEERQLVTISEKSKRDVEEVGAI